MVLLVRFILTMILSRFRPRIEPTGEARVRFTALPHDCDLNFHLNSGRYLSFMDVARMDLIGRLRLLSPLLRRGWRPVMGGCVIRFRRSVMPFERFTIRSRVVAWDDKWFYIEHIVDNKDGDFCAAGHVRTVIRGKSGNIPTRDVVALFGRDIASPELPDFVAQWRALEDAR